MPELLWGCCDHEQLSGRSQCVLGDYILRFGSPSGMGLCSSGALTTCSILGFMWMNFRHESHPIYPAVSSSKCNELMMMLKKVEGVRHKQFCRALPSGALTRMGIKFPGDGIKLELSETGEVCSPGEILPEQAVGVLVDAALPMTVRVGEVGLDG